jgi:DNA-directed RNA polymerase subunit RPC12/RpoP
VGDKVELFCNECSAIVRNVPVEELQKTLDGMVLDMDFASAKCPHCGAINLLPGFTEMLAFICLECGRTVSANLAE